MTNRENEEKQARNNFRQRIKSIKSLFDDLEKEVLTYGIRDIKTRNVHLQEVENTLKQMLQGMKLFR